MSITYPPELLPSPNDGDTASVFVCSNARCCLKDEVEQLRAALSDVLPSVYSCMATDDARWLAVCKVLGRDPEDRTGLY